MLWVWLLLTCPNDDVLLITTRRLALIFVFLAELRVGEGAVRVTHICQLSHRLPRRLALVALTVLLET